jgi:drug/metabolite transporter (DMT)-like permease
MGKYSSRIVKPSMPKRNTVNPYMRGIGCLLMLIVPAFSYGVGDLLAGQGFGSQVVPREWYGYITFPAWLSNLAGLNAVLQFLAKIPHLPATLAITVVVMIIIGGIMSVIFGWMYSLLAPSQYGPMDVPPPRVKTKKYKR